jgi:hypothetical protein
MRTVAPDTNVVCLNLETGIGCKESKLASGTKPQRVSESLCEKEFLKHRYSSING